MHARFANRQGAACSGVQREPGARAQGSGPDCKRASSRGASPMPAATGKPRSGPQPFLRCVTVEREVAQSSPTTGLRPSRRSGFA